MQQSHELCKDNDTAMPGPPSLPEAARLSINRCNLPAVILGSLTYQHHPTALHVDGVRELHRRLFDQLDQLSDAKRRADHFTAYMAAHFLLNHPEEAGLALDDRARLDYRRLVRGWYFDAESQEAAVIKGWAESRFGLLTRFHRVPIRTPGEAAYYRFLQARATALCNSNALDSQLDLIFAFCQYELARRFAGQTHLTLYRGLNRFSDHEVLEQTGRQRFILLLNNVSSFTASRERADEFGDIVLRAEIPIAKVFFCTDLLPHLLKSEGEHIVIGGVCEVIRL